MNTWPGIKGRLQPITLATTKGRWALAWGQVLHMATKRGTSHADRGLQTPPPRTPVYERVQIRERPPACAASGDRSS
ncbi:uncharacterized protein ACO6RY_19661 [Pungitius sinensis]